MTNTTEPIHLDRLWSAIVEYIRTAETSTEYARRKTAERAGRPREFGSKWGSWQKIDYEGSIIGFMLESWTIPLFTGLGVGGYLLHYMIANP